MIILLTQPEHIKVLASSYSDDFNMDFKTGPQEQQQQPLYFGLTLMCLAINVVGLVNGLLLKRVSALFCTLEVQGL